MILDNNLVFCDSVDVSSTAGTANEGDVIDLDALGRNLRDTLYLVISVAASFASAGAATISFKLVSDDSGTPATSGAESLHWQSDTFAYTALTAGKKIIVPMPGGLAEFERYLGLQVVTAGATSTAGTIDAFLTNDVQDWKAYADGEN